MNILMDVRLVIFVSENLVASKNQLKAGILLFLFISSLFKIG